MRLTFVRHGSCDWNQKGLLRGRSDMGLSTEGIFQAQRLAEYLLSQNGGGEIYSSPLKRAFETAQIIGGKLRKKVHVLDELTGADVGSWQGRPLNELIQRYGDLYLLDRYDNGEMYEEVMRRMQKAIRGMASNSIIVSHGDPIAAALASSFGVPHERIGRFYPQPASISVLIQENGGQRLEPFNLIP